MYPRSESSGDFFNLFAVVEPIAGVGAAIGRPRSKQNRTRRYSVRIRNIYVPDEQCSPLHFLKKGRGSLPRPKEKRRKTCLVLLTQCQKFRRVHGLVLVGDAEMDMGAHDGLHQGGIAHGADGLSQGDGITGFYG